MELTGKVTNVLPIENGTSKSGNAWQKQNFVIETAGQYPKKVCLQLFGDKVNERPAVGDEVKVSFDAESREWQGRWFTQLNAWKVEKQNTQSAATAPQQVAQTETKQADDDLPF